MAIVTRQAAETVYVDRFCDGIIGPSSEQLGPVRDGGHIIANTAPGLLGPDDHAGHQGRPRGDAAGRGRGRRGGRRDRDPDLLDRRHLDRDVVRATTARTRAGSTATRTAPRCARAAAGPTRRRWWRASARTASAAPSAARRHRRSRFTHGYTIALDAARGLGVTVGEGRATELAHDARRALARAGELDPEPDPAVRTARPRRRRRADAPVHGPARHDARRSTCPTRTTPATSARSCSARRMPAPSRRSSSSSAPTATWTSTPCAPARS